MDIKESYKVKNNMYIRTIWGGITKTESDVFIDTYNCNRKSIELSTMLIKDCRKIFILPINDIKKTNKKLIYILEKGDIVNGNKVISINYEQGYLTTNGTEHIHVICDDQIKTILTKEQISEHSYEE